MTDVDAGSPLLPVVEEDTPNSKLQADITQHKPGDGTVVGDSDRQERELPPKENLPTASVSSAYADEVREDLRQVRECGAAQSQPAASKEEQHV